MWQATAQPLFQYYHIYLHTRQELKIHRWHCATQQHSCVAQASIHILLLTYSKEQGPS